MDTPPPATLPATPLAIWSLVLGILSLVACGAVAGVPAIICGHIARSEIRKSPATLGGDGMALAGLITGYSSIALTVAFILIFVLFFATSVPLMQMQSGGH